MGKRYAKPFKYKPKNPSKYVGNVDNIVMRSTWERKFAIWCDLNPSVLKWNSEGMAIKYFHTVDNRVRNYFIDFFVQLKTKDGQIAQLAIEVKPFEETQPPTPPKRQTEKAMKNYTNALLTYQRNMDKWNAARKWCSDNGFQFVIMTEYELGLKKK